MYYGRLSDADSSRISTYFYDLPSTACRRNVYTSATTPGGPGHGQKNSNGKDDKRDGRDDELRIVNLLDLAGKGESGAFAYLSMYIYVCCPAYILLI